VDTSGNWNNTGTKDVTIIDNDKPVITDNTPATATTGDSFTFTADVTDNMAVSDVYVEYWYGTGEHTNVSMEEGSYVKTIVVGNTLETLHYIISASDTSGNWNNTGTKDVTIIDNDPPSVSITSGPSGTINTASASFSWSGSDNIGGIQYSYKLEGYDSSWSSWSSAKSKSYSGLDDDSYTFRVKAKDGAGNTASDSRSFTVNTNEEPTASFTYTPSSPTDLDTITFDASDSFDPDGTIANWTWNFGDGSESYEKNPTHKYEDNGTYTVTLTVTDDKGATDTVSKQIEVLNEPPTAYFTYQPTDKVKVNKEVTFTDESTDKDGTIVNYTWNFGDGNISYEKNPTHKYAKANTYTVTLTITDNDGATDSSSLDITVKKEQASSMLPILAIIILIIIAIAVVIIWRRRTGKQE